MPRRRPRRPLLFNSRQEGAILLGTSRSSSAIAPTTRSAGASSSPTKRWTASKTSTRKRTREITRAFRHWDDIDVFFKGQKVTSGGHGFCGIGRIKLAANSSEARSRPRREVDFPDRDHRPRLVRRRLRSGDCIRRRFLHHPAQVRKHFQAQYSAAPESLHLARQQKETRRVHLRFCEYGMGLVQSACVPLRCGLVHVHRRDAGEKLAESRHRQNGAGRIDRAVRKAICRPARRQRVDLEREALEGLGRVAEIQSRAVREMVPQKYRADWRRGAHRAFQHRLGNKTRDGRCHRAHAGAFDITMAT